jgi:SagB-type dehydrogenase family enzyme
VRRRTPSSIGPFRRLAIPGSPPQVLFHDVVTARESKRSLSPARTEDLGYLLWYAVRIQSGTPEGIQHRLAASAGGLHPIDVLLLRRRRLYWYDPLRHGLQQVDVALDLVDDAYRESKRLLRDAHGDLLVLAGHSEVTGAKYRRPASLVWRDAGCMLQAIYFAAAASSLGACALGILGQQLVAAAYASSSVVGAGLCAVGRIRG